MKKLIFLLSLGLLIKVFVSVTAIHPDFRAVNLASKLIVTDGQILTFYDYISKLPRNNSLVQLYGDNLFIYPPLAYLYHAPFYAILQNVYPQPEWNTLIADIGALRNLRNTPILLLLLKLPYLVVDLLGVVLLYKFVEQKNRLLAIFLWWFNPVILYSAYAIGQFDIVISVLLLITLTLTRKNSPISSLLLGIAAGFKPFPLILIPFLPGKKLVNIGIGFLTYLLIIIPYLSSPGFRMYALFADQSSKLLFAKVYVSQTQYISLFIVIYSILLALNVTKKLILPKWGWYAYVLLLFYSISNFHPQWFTWIIPTLIIGIITNRRLLKPSIVLIVCYFLIIFSFDPSLHLGLFNINLDPLSVINRFIERDMLTSWIRSFFVITSLWIIHKTYKFQIKE